VHEASATHHGPHSIKTPKYSAFDKRRDFYSLKRSVVLQAAGFGAFRADLVQRVHQELAHPIQRNAVPSHSAERRVALPFLAGGGGIQRRSLSAVEMRTSECSVR
jgi:hypothetical protein